MIRCHPTMRTMSTADSTAAVTTHGLDVSHWRGTIAWCLVAANGAKFAYMKATEGTWTLG